VGNEWVYQIALMNPGLTFGDIWLAFGSPTYSVNDTRYRPSNGGAFLFYVSMWLGTDGINTRVRIQCPANFGRLLQAPVRTLILWRRVNPVTMTSPADEVSDLRSAFREVCR
jgi:hypothetical protein